MRNGADGWPGGARHCLRIGAMNDKRIVEESQDSFDVVVLQANLAVSAARGLGSWTKLDNPFWIDPIAYAFTASPRYLMSRQKVSRGSKETKLDFKRTFRALSDAYGPPFTRLTDLNRSLEPSDFEPASDQQVVRQLVEWQRAILSPPEEDAKYLETSQLEPVLLTVPFFPLQRARPDDDPRWLAVNLRFARAAADLYADERSRLAVGLLVETSLFDSSEQPLEGIIGQYLDLPIDHLWLWISDNEEVEMTVPRAERLLSLVERAAARGKHVHQAFGGSFSVLMLQRGLTSIGHGVAYWEHKNWEPLAGGGLPTLRYFYPPLRRRLTFLDADQVVDTTGIADAEEFHSRVCDCSMCRRTLNGDLGNFAAFGRVEVRTRVDKWGNAIEYDVPLPESLYRTKRHYLEAKANEVAQVTAERFDAGAVLLEAIEQNREQEVDDLRHLEEWREVLTQGTDQAPVAASGAATPSQTQTETASPRT